MGKVRLLLGISIFWLPLSLLSDGLNSIVLPHLLLGVMDEGSRATALGGVTFIGIALGALAQPVAGAYSDRLRSRWGRQGTIGAGVVLLLGSLYVLGATQVLMVIFLGYMLVQLASSVAQAALQGFIPDLVPVNWRGTAAGLKGFMDIGGALIGFLLLGSLLEYGQLEAALSAVALVILVAFLLTLILVHESRPVAEATGPLDPWQSFRLNLRENRVFAWLVASRFLFLLGAFAVSRFLLFFVADRLGLGPGEATQQAGALLAGLTLVTVLASPTTGWMADRFGRMPLMVSGVALSTAGVLLLILATDSLLILLFGGIMSLGTAAYIGASWALTTELVPSSEAARLLGLANLGTAGASAVAGLLGPLIDWANAANPGSGYTILFAASAVAYLASAGLLTMLRDGDVTKTGGHSLPG